MRVLDLEDPDRAFPSIRTAASKYVDKKYNPPPEFIKLTEELQSVFKGRHDISELKSAATNATLVILGWQKFCDDSGYFAFQEFLFGAFQQVGVLFRCIDKMPTTIKTHHVEKLSSLWNKCNQENISYAIHFCHNIQKEIADAFQQIMTEELQSFSPHVAPLLQKDGRRVDSSEYHRTNRHKDVSVKNTKLNIADFPLDELCPEIQRESGIPDEETAMLTIDGEESSQATIDDKGAIDPAAWELSQNPGLNTAINETHTFTNMGEMVPKSISLNFSQRANLAHERQKKKKSGGEPN